MLTEHYEQIESIAFNLSLFILFVLMTIAVHDVLSKNNVPIMGRIAAYSVLFFGAIGFLSKGIIQIFWQLSGVGG